MKKFLNTYEKIKWPFFFISGLVIALFSCAAYLVIGTHSYIQIHDQLDGEVLNYIYQAKYLFSGSDIIPEFMNGMSAASMTPPAPLGVLFYRFLPPFTAFAAMHIFIIVLGYIGAFLLFKLLTNQPFICCVTAGLFVYLPFYPVYGLSILGQPLLCYALWQIYSGKQKRILYYLCIFLYGAGSSFALIGYAWIAILMLLAALSWFKNRSANGLGISFLILTCTYMLCNLQLLKNFFGLSTSSYTSHREEMILSDITDLKTYFLQLFMEGTGYAQSFNQVIIILALWVLVLCPFMKRTTAQKTLSNAYKILAGLFFLNLLIVLAACLWKSAPVIALRTGLGGALKSFQADRILWLLPLSWYTILALSLYIILIEWKMLRGIRYLISLVALLLLCNMVYENSTIYHNLRLMVFPDTYRLMNWDHYYAVDVYEQIDDFIGKEKESYRVVSLGVTPAAALYNGFYCLDGYSNMYSLEYKHEFREIIADELEKDSATKAYFDDWGNRCYLLNSETGNYVLIDKWNDGTFANLSLNTHQMYQMGARYLFAAMPLDNADELGLTLLRETPFSTQESYFEVWVYELKAEDFEAASS